MMIWKFLIPVMLFSKPGGKYTAEFTEWPDTGKTKCYTSVNLKEEYKKIFSTAAKCKVPLAVAQEGNKLTCYRLRLERAGNCVFLARPESEEKYPFQFRVNFEDLNYTLSPQLNKEKLELAFKADSNAKVAIVFNDSQMIKDIVIYPFSDKSKDYLPVNTYYPQRTSAVAFSDSAVYNLVISHEALNKLVKAVYEKECCEVTKTENEDSCIPFRYYRTGCDKKARQVSQYITDQGYKCMILTIKSKCGIAIHVYDPIINQQINWPLHIAVGIEYGTDTIVIDPTVFHVTNINSLQDATTDYKLDKWIDRFRVNFCEGNEGMDITSSPITIFNQGGVFHSSDAQIAGARRRQLDHLEDMVQCNCFSSFSYYY